MIRHSWRSTAQEEVIGARVYSRNIRRFRELGWRVGILIVTSQISGRELSVEDQRAAHARLRHGLRRGMPSITISHSASAAWLLEILEEARRPRIDHAIFINPILQPAISDEECQEARRRPSHSPILLHMWAGTTRSPIKVKFTESSGLVKGLLEKIELVRMKIPASPIPITVIVNAFDPVLRDSGICPMATP